MLSKTDKGRARKRGSECKRHMTGKHRLLLQTLAASTAPESPPAGVMKYLNCAVRRQWPHSGVVAVSTYRGKGC
jgi:hypothetical protein